MAQSKHKYLQDLSELTNFTIGKTGTPLHFTVPSCLPKVTHQALAFLTQVY